MRRMTTDRAGHDQTGIVQCPICLDSYPWPSEPELFQFDDSQGYVPVDILGTATETKRAIFRRSAHIRCPNPSNDHPTHYLPLLYAAYRPPIVIGLIGRSRSGKTHLLAAMIGEIENGKLTQYGLKADALDIAKHRRFIKTYSRPLLLEGRCLDGTVAGLTDFADALLVSSDHGSWPVAFFDVGGEDLGRLAENTRFLNALTALLFVADPGFVFGSPNTNGRSGHIDRPRAYLGEETFRAVLSQLHPAGGYLDLPAAIVVNKSDRLRFLPPVDGWLRRRPDGTVDPQRILDESRDVYAFLHQQGAGPLLQPYGYCRQCTLHFVSATGGEVAQGGGCYPRGARPVRVLEPLVALLTMSGVLGDETAGKVGV